MNVAPIIRAVRPGTPWLIHGGRGATDSLLLAAMNAGEVLPKMMIDRHDGAEQKPYQVSGGVAVVGVSGSLVNFEMHPAMMQWLGLCAYSAVIRAVDAAAADRDVRAIVIDFDSPGGMCWGLPDAADAIERAGSVKPVVGHTRSICGSSAYWLGSVCKGMYAEGQAIVGSIGTIVTMYDYSGAFAKMGIEPVAVASHERKAAGTEGMALRDEDLDDVRELVSEISGEFVRTVARGRGMGVDAALKLATGRVWTAVPAARLSLTDGVMKFNDLVARLATGGPTNARA